MKFCNESKKFYSVNNENKQYGCPKSISNNVNYKTDILSNRYEIIYEKLNRNNNLAYKKLLKPIEYLLSCGIALQNVVVLAMLSQYKDGKWFLEDATGIVQVNLENTKYHKVLNS